jgi:hypothetical protein
LVYGPVAAQLIREYIYLYGAVSPKDGTCVYLIMPTSNTECFQVFLEVLARRFARQDILLVLDGAPNHCCGDLAIPDNITLLRDKLQQAVLYIERNPNLVRSITSFPYIVNSL